MSFRRDGKARRAWEDWRARHAPTLAACGLPDVVCRDEIAWENFLVDGFLPDGSGSWSGWKIEMLSPEQARRFYHFLEDECADHPFQQNMVRLLRRCCDLGAGS